MDLIENPKNKTDLGRVLDLCDRNDWQAVEIQKHHDEKTDKEMDGLRAISAEALLEVSNLKIDVKRLQDRCNLRAEVNSDLNKELRKAKRERGRYKRMYEMLNKGKKK